MCFDELFTRGRGSPIGHVSTAQHASTAVILNTDLLAFLRKQKYTIFAAVDLMCVWF